MVDAASAGYPSLFLSARAHFRPPGLSARVSRVAACCRWLRGRGAAVCATVIGLSFVRLWGLRRKLVNWKIIFKTAAVTLVVAVALLPIILPFYVDRFSTVDVADVSEDPNTALRLVQTASAVDNFLDHPVFGNGTASFQLTLDGSNLAYKIGVMLGLATPKCACF